jgi:hypothetical protein
VQNNQGVAIVIAMKYQFEGSFEHQKEINENTDGRKVKNGAFANVLFLPSTFKL